jgi:hypothetical protein
MILDNFLGYIFLLTVTNSFNKIFEKCIYYLELALIERIEYFVFMEYKD